MKQIRNVLVATDFSEASLCAVEYAALLAARNGARLHVVHVRALFEDLYEEGLADHERFQRALDHAAEARLEEAPQRVDVEVVRRVLRGTSAPAEIVAYSGRHDIDMVVVGTRGRTGFSHVLLGSVAQMVVRLSSISVLVVHHEEGAKPPRADFHEILCPLDFSPQSAEAFEAALSLAARHGSRLRTLHVVEDTPAPAFYRARGSNAAADLPHIRELAQREIEQLRKRWREGQTRSAAESARPVAAGGGGDDVDIEIVVTAGRAPRAIVDAAREHRTDLVVMGSSGLSGARKYLVGSVAEKVLRTAPCPVLIVKGHPDALEM